MRLCSIASGSSGNCIYAGTDTTHVLVDAGISGKKIEEGLANLKLTGDKIDALFITHEHVDHIKGAGILSRRFDIPIFATPDTWAAMEEGLGRIAPSNKRIVYADEVCAVNDLCVKPFRIPHDAAEPVGYRMESGGKSIAIATDLGVYSDYTVQNLTGLDAVLLEANHDEQRIAGAKGHLSNLAAGHLLCEILHDNLQEVLLGHLSKENNYAKLAYETVKLEVTLADNEYKGDDLDMFVANRDTVSDIITV